MEKVLIDPNEPLNVGDIVELHFKTIGNVWLQAAQLALLESRLQNKEGYRYISHSVANKTELIMTFEITKTNPVIVTALHIAGVVIAAGIVWLSLKEVYKIIRATTEPFKEVLNFLQKPIGFGVMGLVGYYLFKRL